MENPVQIPMAVRFCQGVDGDQAARGHGGGEGEGDDLTIMSTMWRDEDEAKQRNGMGRGKSWR
jgi:hypothetical protein